MLINVNIVNIMINCKQDLDRWPKEDTHEKAKLSEWQAYCRELTMNMENWAIPNTMQTLVAVTDIHETKVMFFLHFVSLYNKSVPTCWQIARLLIVESIDWEAS